MNTVYHLDINSEVTHHFENVLKSVETKSESQVIKSVEFILVKLKNKNVEKFVSKHMVKLESMLEMLLDTKWRMSKEDRHHVLSALQYFSEENDLIPDHIPVVGLLDDCIVIDIIAKKVKHELEAYHDFVCATKVYASNKDFGREEWLETKRQELFSRMRHRRSRGKRSHRTRGTSFSIV